MNRNTIENEIITSLLSTFKQLKTSDETFFMTFDLSIEKFIENKKQKFYFSISQHNLYDFQSINNSNVFTKRKNKGKISFDQFSKIDNIPLDMTKIKKKTWKPRSI